MNGGMFIFDMDIFVVMFVEGYISVDMLVVGVGDYIWKGCNYQVNGMGDVFIDVFKLWNDFMVNNFLMMFNLLEYDDSYVGV